MISDRYLALLRTFSANKQIIELIQECILDDAREREEFYLINKKYPEKRELILKLKNDLETVVYMDNGGKYGRNK